MSTPGQAARNLRRFARSIPKQSNEIKKKAAIEVLTSVVPATPRDTGQAQGNYITSVGAADRATVRPGPSPGDASISKGRSVINSAQPGKPIFITNNLRYIGLLNAGRSKKAPAGFVQRAAMRARALIRRQKIKWEF